MDSLIDAYSFPPIDPFYANVVLHMRFDGDIIDQKGKTFAVDGSVASSSPGKFNGAANINGASTSIGGSNVIYLVTPTTALWLDDGDFTIEGWIKNDRTNNDRPRTLIRLSSSGDFAEYFNIGILEDGAGGPGALRFGYRDSGGGSVGQQNVTIVATTGQWFHLAMTRQGDTLRFFVNGDSAGLSSVTSTYRLPSEAISCFIGNSRRSFIDALCGEIDDVRITKGVARYTANFTPPAAPFPSA